MGNDVGQTDMGKVVDQTGMGKDVGQTGMGKDVGQTGMGKDVGQTGMGSDVGQIPGAGRREETILTLDSRVPSLQAGRKSTQKNKQIFTDCTQTGVEPNHRVNIKYGNMTITTAHPTLVRLESIQFQLNKTPKKL
ncbi:hypothetical protein AVEN_151544-1 [Araneus ventricosus]|nr:hypothetical protein AVEN_151544-1 [Araneus ventricosus]